MGATLENNYISRDGREMKICFCIEKMVFIQRLVHPHCMHVDSLVYVIDERS
jgi:hypothetical protein